MASQITKFNESGFLQGSNEMILRVPNNEAGIAELAEVRRKIAGINKFWKKQFDRSIIKLTKFNRAGKNNEKRIAKYKSIDSQIEEVLLQRRSHRVTSINIFDEVDKNLTQQLKDLSNQRSRVETEDAAEFCLYAQLSVGAIESPLTLAVIYDQILETIPQFGKV